MYLLHNTIKPYAWGSESAISDLLGMMPSEGPEAELWIGAHPQSPSLLSTPTGDRLTLDEFISADSETTLGEAIDLQFAGRLPYLMKVLAADSPLSIQVHPSQEQARRGFAGEEAAGIPIDAPHRNYKDPNHKPEMIYALTPFEALCGFRERNEAAAVLHQMSQLLADDSPESRLLAEIALALSDRSSVKCDSDSFHIRSAFHRIIRNEGGLVSRAVERLSMLGLDEPAAHARDLRTIHELHSYYPADPGVLVALLLNRVSLAPGQALYLPAGNIHAYLRGVGIEVMAASDNVLRGGLTPKHVDIPELMKTVAFEQIAPPMVAADTSAGELEIYRPPFEEFQLQRIFVPAGEERCTRLVQNGPLVVLVLSGELSLEASGRLLRLSQGQSAFIPADSYPVVANTDACASPAAEGTLAFAVTVSEKELQL